MGGGGGGGVGRAAGFSLCSQNIYGLCFDVEEETTASNDWIFFDFEPFWGHIFMKALNNQFCDPPLPSPFTKMNNKYFFYKQKNLQTCDRF